MKQQVLATKSIANGADKWRAAAYVDVWRTLLPSIAVRPFLCSVDGLSVAEALPGASGQQAQPEHLMRSTFSPIQARMAQCLWL